VIDDNEVDRYIARHILTKNHFTEKITQVNSAIEALEYLDSLQADGINFPDMIFLDIMMPEMDGFGFLEEFSKYKQSNPAVVMLSSSSDRGDIERAGKHPAVVKFLTKPLHPSMLEVL
jgi:CheY-like chemotaxis protein